MLKPKNVVLPSSSGTHNISVCTSTSKFYLLVEASTSFIELNLQLGLANFSEKITTAHFFAATRCNPPSIDCCMAKCDECAPKF